MPLTIADAPSPNFDERNGAPIDILVLHYTGMETGEASMTRMRDPEAKVAAHYFVDEDGAISQLVPEEKRAWHAGAGCWKGERDVNARSIGIEIQNGGHDFGLPDFAEPQIVAVIALSKEVLKRHPIPPSHVIGHSDLAPARKQDPGEKFPWARLAEEGVGLWPGEQGVTGGLLGLGDEGEMVAEYQMDLATYGYCPPGHGEFDGETADLTRAFQRHFYPEAVTGAADAETRARLKTLLTLSLTA